MTTLAELPRSQARENPRDLFPGYTLPDTLVAIATELQDPDLDEISGQWDIAFKHDVTSDAVHRVSQLLQNPDPSRLEWVCSLNGWELAEAAPEPEPETLQVAPPDPLAPPVTRLPEREADYRTALHKDVRIPHMSFLAGLAIGQHCWKSGELFAGGEQICEWMHLSPKSRGHVPGYLAPLVELGYLTPTGKVGRTTKYQLTIPM